jgi:hypothetical protein
VLAERAKGQRAILPVTTPLLSRTRFRLGLIGAAAAAAVAIVLAQTRPGADNNAVVSSGLFIGTAYAEQVAAAPAAPSVRLGSGSLRARRYSYSIDFVDGGGRVARDGGGSIDVSETSFDGRPAWRVALAAEQTEDDQLRTIAETLVVAKADLRLLTRVVHVRPYRRFSFINIVQRFDADSVLGEMTSEGGIRRPIAHRLPSKFGPFLSDALAPLALVGTPLTPNSVFSLSLVGWAVIPMDVFYPVTIRVVGEERLKTASGVFDCWKLDVAAGSEHRLEWVRKSDGIALRSYDTRTTTRGNRRFELLDP